MPRPRGEETSCLLAAAADIEEVPFGERRHSHSTDGGGGNKNGDPTEAKRAGTAEDLAEVVGGPGGGVAVRSNGESGNNPFQDDGLAVWEKDRREPEEEEDQVAAATIQHQQVRITM